MSRKEKIDPSFYETHDFAEDIAEAKRNGTLGSHRPCHACGQEKQRLWHVPTRSAFGS
jgi:hypothetical protein